jgi:hypothetical protein
VLLLTIDVAVGVLLILLVGALALRTVPRRADRVREAGWLLVAVPLPAAVALHLALALPQATDQVMFLVGVAAFAIGAALVLGADDEDDWSHDGDDSPPWWPDFERQLRDYERDRDRLIRT